MMRIVGELPYQYNEDVWLPASLNGYVVEYFINGELVQDMKIDFEMIPFDKEIEMVVKLHFKSAFQEMIVPLVQKGDLDLYNEYMENQYFLDIFKEIDIDRAKTAMNQAIRSKNTESTILKIFESFMKKL